MRKIKFAFTILVVTFLLAGCLQVETTLKVNKDGSGTIIEKVLFSKAFVNMMKDFAHAFQDSASTEEFKIYDVNEIITNAKDYGDNVDCVSHTEIADDKWEGYQAVYFFDDVTQIQISPDPDSKINLEDETASNEEEEEFYIFKFLKGNNPQLIIDRPVIELNANAEDKEDSVETEQSEVEEGEEFLKMMEGMKIDIAVEVEGEITNTNATYVQGSRVTLFQMDFTEMMKNKEGFKEFKKNEPKNIDEIKMYLEKLPGIKVEVEKPITINFK